MVKVTSTQIVAISAAKILSTNRHNLKLSLHCTKVNRLTKKTIIQKSSIVPMAANLICGEAQFSGVLYCITDYPDDITVAIRIPTQTINLCYLRLQDANFLVKLGYLMVILSTFFLKGLCFQEQFSTPSIQIYQDQDYYFMLFFTILNICQLVCFQLLKKKNFSFTILNTTLIVAKILIDHKIKSFDMLKTHKYSIFNQTSASFIKIVSKNKGVYQLNSYLDIKYLIQKYSNMWNEFLNQSRSQHKFQNTNLIILGGKHSGKRSLIDSLFDISKTTIHNKRLAAHSDTNKMRLKGLTTAIDYAYLNVLELSDPDYRTHTKLQIFMIQEQQNPCIYKEISNPDILKNSVIIIMLDYTNPWNFMSELDKWVKFIYELQKNAGFKINELDQMKKKVEQYFKNYSEPAFDEFGKLKRNFDIEQSEKVQIPIPQGCLTSNLRIPLIVCVNKCDLMSGVLRDQSANKINFILYHLRKFCIQYGGTLIYTSIRNNSNLNLLYQYILHRSYKMPLRFKAEAVNEEAIFIPLGFDNLNLLNDSTMKVDVNKPYQEVILSPSSKKNLKQEIIVEQDYKFFQKYASMQGQQSASSTSVSERSNTVISENPSSAGSGNNNVTDFFKKLLEKDKDKRTAAEKTLDQKTAEIRKKQERQHD